jgi:DNA-binding NarL/FixJ family response regulator
MLLELKSALPHSSVVLWSDPLPGECIRRALEAGVRGILYKHAEIEAYGECLRAVMRGHIWLESDRPADARKPGQAALTPRQRQLVDMLAQGLRNKEIAWRLGISEGTVKVYLSQLYGKLGVGDRLELALLAVRPICPPQANYTVPATAGAMPIA